MCIRDSNKADFEKVIRVLDTSIPRFLTAELNMGLDNITLHDEWSEISILKSFIM